MENKMIEYKIGDILKQDVEAIVNTVNCVGVMGRGLAQQFKNKYPQNFKEYTTACKKEEVLPGKMFVHHTGQLTNPKYIINFPTKRHWKGKSKLEDIESGLDDLLQVIQKLHIKSIAIPPLGSGLGGLDWRVVKEKITQKLADVQDVQISIFEPLEASVINNISKEVPKMTAGRAALVELMDRYLRGLMDPFVSLLEVHKLVYFMQEAGEPLRLKFEKAHYGPYANNLRHVLSAVEGHLISGYEDGGDNPAKQLKLVPGAIEDAKKFLMDNSTTGEHFMKVSNLVEGFETPFGLELLSTVHWVVKNENADGVDEVIEKIYSWNERKKQFTKRQIEIAMKRLIENNWITIEESK